jgi:uncharacterized protein YjiK
MFYTRRRKTLLIQASILVILLSLIIPTRYRPALAQSPAMQIEEVGRLETDDLNLFHPAGLIFSPDANAFFILSTDQPDPATTSLALISPSEDWLGAVTLPATLTDPTNMAFDPQANRLIFFEAATTSLVEVKAGPGGSLNPNALTRIPAQPFGLQQPQGLVFSPDGRLFILDTDRLIQIQPDPTPGLDSADALEQGQVSTVDLAALGLAEARGLAFNPDNGHLYLLSPASQILVEITQTGQEVSRYELAEFSLNDPQGLVFAPSRDSTDNPAVSHLFIADTGLPFAAGYILELDFTPPTLGALADVEAILVHTIDTSSFNPPNPDPTGLAYDSSANTLLIGDSEVDEEASLFRGVNIFEITLTGSLVATHTTWIPSLGDTPPSFSHEPVGLAFNPLNQHVFVSDDSSKDEVYEVTLGSDGRIGTPDDVLTSFDTKPYSENPEGITFDPVSGDLFIVDGKNLEVYRIDPGANGRFDGETPVGDDQRSSFDISGMGLTDSESIEFNPDDGHLYIMSGPADIIAETTTTGILIRTIGFAAAANERAGGLAIAPASDNPAVKHFYIGDRGDDVTNNPEIGNDGRIYEFSLDPFALTLAGPAAGIANTNYTFTATVTPNTTALPITYVWSATGQVTVTHTNIPSRNDGVAFNWTSPGAKVITVTATNSAGSTTRTHTITIKAPATGVTLSGPAAGQANQSYAFTASVSPLSATTPLSYTWQATDQTQLTRSAGLNDTLPFTWATTGPKVITVTVTNGAGTPVQSTKQVLIVAPGTSLPLHLPLIIKNNP